MASNSEAAQLGPARSSVPIIESVARGRYQLDRQLGRGGAAAVFRARDMATGGLVAVKRLVSGASARLTSLFELEYHALSSLRHPNIVEVYDFGSDERGPYYVMELLEGEDLSGRAPMPWREAAGYACQIASALSVVHARRLLHRDVSARNVWRLPSHELKLIDFGALTAFGTPREIVGTPPHVAPEAIAGRPLDQRTDLYGLGALLYWLLSGAHAYPARTLRDLPGLWNQPLSSVSERLSRQEQAPLAQLPKELDALVMELLSENPMARPGTTGEVIDRLSALLGIESQPRHASDISLTQPNLVGRERERKHLRRELSLLREGRGEATVFAAARGAGRTRLLLELSVDARVSGMSVLHVQAKGCTGAHAVADALVQRLFDVVPDVAHENAQGLADVLAHLSKRVQERLSVAQLVPLPGTAGEARAHVHLALTALFVAVARQTPLVILIDDLESADESSVSWLTALSERLSELPILIGLGLCEAALPSDAYAHHALRQHSRRVVLQALTADETHSLLASLFGEVPHLVRLSERAHRLSHGLPARLVDVARKLVREGAISNDAGTWVLPQDLPDEQLELEREQGIKGTLARLSPAARTMGALLGIRRGVIPLELCKVLSALDGAALFAALEELMREGVVATAQDGYVFEDELFCAELEKELSRESRKQAHERVGRFLLSQGLSKTEQLEALVHLMEGGDAVEAPARITRIALDLMKDDPDQAIAVAPALERALTLFRALGKQGEDLIPLLVPLSVSGYFSDFRLAKRYGNEALLATSRALAIDWILKLTPWLGKRLSLGFGFAFSLLRNKFRRSRCAASFRENIELFFHSIAAHAGVSTLTVNASEVARCARLTSPFTVLGKQHIACFVHEFNTSLWFTMSDRIAQARARWQATLAQLEGAQALVGFNEQIRLRYLGGALYALGFLECWRDSPEVLRIADRLENFELKLYHMSADQLRTVYYANQGNRALYERYRARAELHAIQRGSAWQVETWAPGATVVAAVRSHDAMSLKASHELLQRLEKRIPSMAIITRRCRASFLLLRKRYAEALPLLEKCLQEPPLELIGWGRAHGMLAACLNALGQHARAKEVCRIALDRVTAEDLMFSAMNLPLQIELAHAEAGLGERRLAAQMLDELLSLHAQNQAPLTLGALHEARARVALSAADLPACELHTREMERYYRGTDLPSLVARCESLAREQRRAFRDAAPHGGPQPLTDASSTGFSAGPTTLERALSEVGGSLEIQAQVSLTILARGVGARAGALFAFRNGDLALLASLDGRAVPDALRPWLIARLAQADNDDVTQTDFGGDAALDPDILQHAGVNYRVFPLREGRGVQAVLIGAVMLSEEPGVRHFVGAAALKVVAHRVRGNQSVSSVQDSISPQPPEAPEKSTRRTS